MWNHVRQQKKYQKTLFSLVMITVLLGGMSEPVLAAPTQEWVTRYNGPSSGMDSATAMAVDAAGNVYVTGPSTGTGTYYNDGAFSYYAAYHDYATIKYDSNGNQLWVARYNGPANRHDIPIALAVDAIGNVYVTGYSAASRRFSEAPPGQFSAYDSDYATVKYDANGNQLWVARYNGPASTNDGASALGLDSAGNVYVTGHSEGSMKIDPTYFFATYDEDYATVKYDTNGNQLWVARYNGSASEGATALAVDKTTNNVYITGNSNGDYSTIKYDNNGNQLWLMRYNGPGNSYDAARAVGVDAAGNAYVTGESMGVSSSVDYATVKYDSNGNQLWAARYNGPTNANNNFDSAYALAVDAIGNVFVTGESDGAGTLHDIATIKYDGNGNQSWVVRHNGTGSGYDVGAALTTDGAGNVYVTGTNFESVGICDYVTLKYDSNGNKLWQAGYNSLGNGYDGAAAIALHNNHVYVTGYGAGDFATIKYTQNRSPVANAGSDQTMTTISSKAIAITLSGSASSDPDGDTLTYTWSGAFGVVTGANAVVRLIPGSYPITLTVSDGQMSASDTVMIEIIKTKK